MAALPIEQAHLFGVGGHVQEAHDATRKAVADLSRATPDLFDQIAVRAVRQALAEALPLYWLRRAETLEAVGTEWGWAAAVACRRHAWLLSQEPLADELCNEVAATLEVV